MTHRATVKGAASRPSEVISSPTALAVKVIPDALRNFDQLPDSANVRLPVVMALFGCSSATVWRMAQRNELKPRKLSQRVTGFNVGELRQALKQG